MGVCCDDAGIQRRLTASAEFRSETPSTAAMARERSMDWSIDVTLAAFDVW
jgi:hypothetical protein